MRHWILMVAFAEAALLAGVAGSQEGGSSSQKGSAQSQGRVSYENMTPQERAERTREFLGLGPAPNRAEAEKGTPLFRQNCSFCHGPEARGAEGPNLVTSELVLDDVHGDKLLPFLKAGRPSQGMPSFAGVPDDELKDIIEFIHLQVENVANRGAYEVKDILVGNAADGKTYVEAHCMTCHKESEFDHIASKFRTPAELQRNWVWPEHPGNPATTDTATVKLPDGGTLEGQVKQISDFKITLLDNSGQTHVIDREPGVDVEVHDPLVAHERLIMALKNDDMHNVTAYLETLK